MLMLPSAEFENNLMFDFIYYFWITNDQVCLILLSMEVVHSYVSVN